MPRVPSIHAVVCFVLLASRAVHAQGVSVYGTVTSVGGAPVGGASVRVEGTDAGARTNDDGKYVLTAPDTLTGRHVTLSSILIGFFPGRITIQLEKPSVNSNIMMEACPMSFTDPILPAPPPVPSPSRRNISHAAGLDDLRHRRGHAIDHEIRLWLWNENGSPFNLYRFVDSSGRKTGQHFTSTHDAHRCYEETTGRFNCTLMSLSGDSHDDVDICRFVAKDKSDWTALWDQVEAAGVSGLARATNGLPSCKDRRTTHYLTVEVWDGKKVRFASFPLSDNDSTRSVSGAERMRSLALTIP